MLLSDLDMGCVCGWNFLMEFGSWAVAGARGYIPEVLLPLCGVQVHEEETQVFRNDHAQSCGSQPGACLANFGAIWGCHN